MTKNLKFMKKLKRKQFTALVQLVLDRMLNVVRSGFPDIVTSQRRREDRSEPDPLGGLTAAEQSALTMGIHTIVALGRARGLILEDSVYSDELCSPIYSAFERLMGQAWSPAFEEAIRRQANTKKQYKEVKRLLGDYWPDTQMLAKDFVDKIAAEAVKS